ncbi:permease [Paenibacillus sp. FSL H7-0357]|uniref:AEC family transporter n=1 Tax=Paenibacillus sp. FSL H7-0357 TaxID=1536774 RepID=UPI0004F738D7|nr:AEC family transporter [Paenibacillus sp. FSL H7-0357]AIQ21135.1 permease [Paenibacillus sp. FSL H7-0357]
MIESVLSTLFKVIVPLSIPVIAGALLGRFKNLDTKPLLTLYLYFLSPAIILDTLATAEISFDDVYKTLSFSLLNLFLLWGLANVLGRILKLAPAEAAGLTLVSTFTNSVNYGLPLVLLAFGQLGLDKASVYVIGQMVIVNTIGVYFAARSQFSVRSAVKSVFSLPAIYAAILALMLRALGLHMPDELASGVAMVAGAYSPVVLAILGAQMVKVKAAQTERNVQLAFWTGITVRLLLAPLLAALVLLLLNITGTLFSVLLILASMPVAVNSVVLAERFSSSPSLVSRCIVWTTLASFLVLPVLIVVVGGV